METKIIKAVFGGGTSTVTNKRTRTDYGQVLEIIGIDLPDTFECIFSNSNTSAGVGKKMIGSSQRVLIPDEYLATGQTIYAWVLVHDGEYDGRHMYSIRIPVADMPDTSPEEPTPVEQSVISQAITALNSAVDTTTQKAQEATESADRAEHAAEGVEGFAERAESAQQAAESARDRATQAETSARTSAQTASTKATESAQSAENALTYKTDAESAKTASQTAQGLAETARDEAVTAKEDAESARDEAQSIADGITGKVEQIDSNTDRIESLEDDRYKPYAVDSASGSIASFPDGADDIPLKSLVVDINPVQDTSSGDPSPTNICPISGWTGCEVKHSGADTSNPTTYPITFPTEAGTVYGGHIDLINGELLVDGVMVDLETFTPSVRYEGDVNKTISITLPKTYAGYGAFRGFVCSAYVVKGGVSSASDLSTPDDKDVGIYRYANVTKPETKTVYFVMPKGLTLNGEMVFFMTVPQTYSLTPTEIKTLLGQNNIWADCGDTSVTYRADTTLYISRLTEPDADMIADSNIVSGQYFMVGNNLYRATANIASGASVIVGTNATKISLAQALNEINA